MTRRRSRSFSTMSYQLRRAGSNRSINNDSASKKVTNVQPFSFVNQDLEKTKKRLAEAKKAVVSLISYINLSNN